jgi:hypothetical protein
MNIVQAIKAYRKTKAGLYGFIGIAISAIINLTPFYIAYLLIFDQGRILLGILFPILFWIIVGFYMAFLPFIWIYGIFAYGFWQSTLSCAILFGVFYLPDFFFALADRQARKAEEIEMRARYYDEPSDLTPLDIAIEHPKGTIKTIIRRGTPIPYQTKLELRLPNARNNLKLDIIQGVGSTIEGYLPLVHTDIFALRQGELPVFVTIVFDVDSTGILNVSAKSDTNEKLKVTSSGYSGLSKVKIQELVGRFGA